MITCPNCGRENADNFNFCLDCGYDLKSYRETLAPAAQDFAPPPDEPEESAFATSAPTESMSADEVNAAAAATGTDTPDPVTTPPMSSPTPAPAPAATPAPASAATPAPSSSGTATATPAASGGTAAATPAAGGEDCPSCGSFVSSGQRFCGSCGYRMDGSSPAPAAPKAAAPAAGRTMFMHATDISAAKPKQKQCKLITIDQSGQEGMTYTLNSGETVCGRVNGIVLFFDDPYVSPTHCLFTFAGDKLKIADKDSLNGVYIRIPDERALTDGDHLRIGRQLFRYETLAAASDEVSRSEGDDAKIWGSPNPGAFGRLLQILEDGRTGEVRLLAGESCNLGREQGEIVFPTDGFISGRHCSFFHQGGSTRIKDLGSSNGTYVRVRGEATVAHGDFVLVGNQMLRVEIQ